MDISDSGSLKLEADAGKPMTVTSGVTAAAGKGSASTKGRAPPPSSAGPTRARADRASEPAAVSVHYDVIALQITIYYNREGDHDHNGMMYALKVNEPVLKYIRALARSDRPLAPSDPPLAPDDNPATFYAQALTRAQALRVALPATPAQAREPHPLVRPLVLRARVGEQVTVQLENQIKRHAVGIHLVGDGYDVKASDGSQVGDNPATVAAPSSGTSPHPTHSYTWQCKHEGVFPFHDGGNYSGEEDGTNVHGLFGALIVEPPGTTWRDPVTGLGSHGLTGTGPIEQMDGLYLDILPAGTAPSSLPSSTTDLSTHDWEPPRERVVFKDTAHREFVVFFHDEPEFVPPHAHHEPNPCDGPGDSSGIRLQSTAAGPGGSISPNHGHTDRQGHRHGGGCGCGCGSSCWCCCKQGLDGAGGGQNGHWRGAAHGGQAGGGHGGAHGAMLPIMPVSYRAEPMINRERALWRMLRSGHDFKGRPVLNEEQHHSSWMFGDPVTPIFRAYIGDPVRIRFVHGGVKETHVFHLHLYEWFAAAGDISSPRIDAISVSPQTAHTIEPAWGAGNRHQVAGDVIWHCHLYPHFHEGMWGMFRTFETRQDGPSEGELADPSARTPLDSVHPVYKNRWLKFYPDGTPIERLLPLPGLQAPPTPTADYPGYPLYIPGEFRQKSPVPPWPDRALTQEELGKGANAADPYNERYRLPCHVTSLHAADMPADFDYRPTPTDLERKAFNELPVPGELFTRNRMREQQTHIYDQTGPNYPDKHRDHQAFVLNDFREVCHEVAVAMRDVVYNSHGWHDKQGHLYYLESEGDPATRGGVLEPLFFRAHHGQILNLTLRNALPASVEETEFDHAIPPCPALAWEGECATHVHMVKFDPICADGASTGWNYMSGARLGMKMVYRWWADREFGTIFFHDHLFANYRQKHGLFGALLVEPAGSSFWHHIEPQRRIVSGVQAMIERHVNDNSPNPDPRNRKWFREFCVGIGDFIPMWDRTDRPLNPPAVPGGHGDQGVMGLNYRSAPVRERAGDPAYWFSSRVHGDPDTTLFRTYANDPVWIRLVQGSHEEQHSFQVHGLRWRRFRANTDSVLRSQQSTGLSEAFTFVNQVPFVHGDYLYRLSGADDSWLGCWGLIRAYPQPLTNPDPTEDAPIELPSCEPRIPALPPPPPPTPPTRKFWVVAEQQVIPFRADITDPFGLVYRLTHVQGPGDSAPSAMGPIGPVTEPLVLWCLDGENVEVELTSALAGPPATIEPEPRAPEVPVERPDRPVSWQVSMHADLVTYDVKTSDGANVGLNPLQTILPMSAAPPGSTMKRTYTWKTARPEDAGHPLRPPLGPVLLQDMADFRNHRHHGLIGALVVLPADASPHAVAAGASTGGALPTWYGARVTVVRSDSSIPASDRREEHMVLLMQDGLRLYLNGQTGFPLPDPPEEEAAEAEKEDQGQKGFNYRSDPIGPVFDPVGSPYSALGTMNSAPATPLWFVSKNSKVRFHLVGALNKPRQYSFTIHGVSWPEHRFGTDRLIVSSESALSTGSVRTLEFTPEYTGDHAYRSGVLKWAVAQGMWGILRVT